MVRLFRKIRRRLANDNQFVKYSRYAIGEILLVVIGILIALQVNNWNEKRKLQVEEVKILEELYQTISSDLAYLNGMTDILERKLSYLKLIKRELVNENGMENDSMKRAFSFALQTTIFTSKAGPYEVLKSNGFNLISNDSLRAQIIDLYDGTYKFVEKGQSNKFINDTYFSEYSLIHFDNIVYADSIQPDLHYYRIIKPHDFQALRRDKIYKTLINSNIAQVEYMIHFVYGTAIKDIEKTLTNLDLELKRLSGKSS